MNTVEDVLKNFDRLFAAANGHFKTREEQMQFCIMAFAGCAASIDFDPRSGS